MTIRSLLLFSASLATAFASDYVGVYARIDKVTLEPNPQTPDTIQIWGVFSLAKPDNRDEFLPPARGYLYLKLGDSKDATRKEWADMKEVAGTKEIIAFGSRFLWKATLRKADEAPEKPDTYVVSHGLSKIRHRTEYPPVRRLLDYKE